MKRLNFGCGPEIIEGFDNVDIQKNPRITQSFNFNKFPYPIKNDTYDYVYSRSVLEHLDNPERVLEELWRICKPNAIIEIIVPDYTNKSAYADLQHKHYFSNTCFEIFVKEACKINKKNMFDIKSLELIPTKIGKFIPKKLREKLSLFLGGLISYIHVKLIVKKTFK